MSHTLSERRIDVRPMPPRDRHPTLFGVWRDLPDLGAILLVNDHNPIPLYHRFATDWIGKFHWEYLRQGPDVWEVRIRKGDFADPGFRPEPGVRGSCRPADVAVPIAFAPSQTLDVRPILADGGSPCEAIESAIDRLVPGQSLVVLAPFEPVPLYTKLGLCGFSHETSRLEDGTWRVEFQPGPETDAEAFVGCGCHGA